MCFIKINKKLTSEITYGPKTALGSYSFNKVSKMSGVDQEAYMCALTWTKTHIIGDTSHTTTNEKIPT